MINQLVRCPNPKRMIMSSEVSEIIIEENTLHTGRFHK
jgi:hypothetical protein